MSNLAWMIVIFMVLTGVGCLALLAWFRFYWGVRGGPPPSREERRAMREETERGRKNES
jgi:hypothetical protein